MKIEQIPTAEVSVLMTVYNTPFNLVKRAINSVLNQDFTDFELIIIDDGSAEILGQGIKKYVESCSAKIRYVRHPNRGQSISINEGVLLSRGHYIAIIDSDDEYKTNHLSACLNEMKHSDLIATHTETIVGSEDDYFVPDKNNPKINIHVDECILFATLFGRVEVFQNTTFKNMYAADNDFFTRAAQFYRVKKVNLQTYIYYRNNADSITAQKKIKQLREPQMSCQ